MEKYIDVVFLVVEILQRSITMKTKSKIVYLMRGVPASGKSYAAKRLARKGGVVCETDSYFGPPGKWYLFDSEFVGDARSRNMLKFSNALSKGISPIVVDRGNGTGRRTGWYVKTAFAAGYTVMFAEPISPWWTEIKALLMDREVIEIKLNAWARVLAEKQKRTHGVPAWRIRKSLKKFNPGLRLLDIL